MASQTAKPEFVEVESELLRPSENNGAKCETSNSQPYYAAKTISDTSSKQQQQQPKRNSKKKKKKKRRLTNKQNDHIIIIGSGLAGLSCALSLEQEGYTNISLYERDTDFDVQKEGYGLTISYNPTNKGPLCKLNLLEKVAQQDCPSRSHYIFRVSLMYTDSYFVVFFFLVLSLTPFSVISLDSLFSHAHKTKLDKA